MSSASCSSSSSSSSIATPSGIASIDFLARIRSQLNLNDKQMQVIEAAYEESVSKSYTESHCQHYIKSKKDSCRMELKDGQCPRHKDDIFAPEVKEKMKCPFPKSDGTCGRTVPAGKQVCALHEGKTPDFQKTLTCQYVATAGKNAGQKCGKSFCPHEPGSGYESDSNIAQVIREYSEVLNPDMYCPAHYLSQAYKLAKKSEKKKKSDDNDSKKKSKKSEDVDSDSEEEKKPKSKKKSKKSEDVDSDSEEKKPKSKKKSKKSEESDNELDEKQPAVIVPEADADLFGDSDDEDEEDEVCMSQPAISYPSLGFSFSGTKEPASLTGLTVGDKRLFRLIEKKDGVRILTPFIVSRDVFESENVTEIIGYTLDLKNKMLAESDMVCKYHPMMEEAVKKYSRSGEEKIVVRISLDIKK